MTNLDTTLRAPQPADALAAGQGLDPWHRLQRFLVLGTADGPYCAGGRALLRESARPVEACLAEDGPRTVAQILTVSAAGRAPRNDEAILALALAASLGDPQTRALALRDGLPRVCRTASELFLFVRLVTGFRRWGRGLRGGVARWYAQPAQSLAYQSVTCRQRHGYTHRDLLRLSHARAASPAHAALFGWLVGGALEPGHPSLALVEAFERAQRASSPAESAALVGEHGLPWQAVQPQHLGAPEVWEALLPRLPYSALVRNLARLTASGMLRPFSTSTRSVIGRLADGEAIRRARVDPLAVLVAMRAYQQGQGEGGRLTWRPVRRVVEALDEAFYAAFANVRPTGKRTLLALDVSASMGCAQIARMPGLTPRVASAALALVTASVERDCTIVAFTAGCGRGRPAISELNVSPSERLDDVLRRVDGLDGGGTDCALPFLWAEQVDRTPETFVVYTDSETGAGAVQPGVALRRYRERSGVAARSAVVGMVSNGFSIADPRDPGMLDVVGFDLATPGLLRELSTGEL